MTSRWIALLALLLCITQPVAAQTVNHHKKTVKHKQHKTHVSAQHKSSHKLQHPIKHHTKTASIHEPDIQQPAAQAEINPAATKIAASTIPQPQFDTSISINSNNTLASLPTEDDDATAPIDTSQQALTALAYRTVETQRYSAYKLGGTVFNPSQGIYKVDCSAYINDLLSQANPQAYSSLTNWTQTYKPTSHDYYKFFTRLPDATTQYWRRINNVQQLQPGGVLVFLTEYLHRHHLYSGSGHVMLVMSKPVPHPGSADTFQVKVADSAPSGHSDDTRLPHKSGIGIGTLLLKVDPFTGRPKAYAWKLNDHWRSNTLFAMALPTG